VINDPSGGWVFNPDHGSLTRTREAVLAEQTDEWTEGRRYMGLELLNKARLIVTDERHDTDQPDPAPIAA
jgi:putative transposase